MEWNSNDKNNEGKTAKNFAKKKSTTTHKLYFFMKYDNFEMVFVYAEL